MRTFLRHSDGPLTGARGRRHLGLRRFDDAGGDEFGQQVVDVHLTKVVLWGGDLQSYRVTTTNSQKCAVTTCCERVYQGEELTLLRERHCGLRQERLVEVRHHVYLKTTREHLKQSE